MRRVRLVRLVRPGRQQRKQAGEKERKRVAVRRRLPRVAGEEGPQVEEQGRRRRRLPQCALFSLFLLHPLISHLFVSVSSSFLLSRLELAVRARAQAQEPGQGQAQAAVLAAGLVQTTAGRAPPALPPPRQADSPTTKSSSSSSAAPSPSSPSRAA